MRVAFIGDGRHRTHGQVAIHVPHVCETFGWQGISARVKVDLRDARRQRNIADLIGQPRISCLLA
ncbi:Uncharacterized protein APZ42_018996 [Daphnia magna]|uniref:Uncharacterized protein n=1 Tax=Daphnia magna TaxID=35525 RepID=A0A164YZA4_9CRUS|nr:Uncharacterized protein APZ42_018996 [Daphnia magna]